MNPKKVKELVDKIIKLFDEDPKEAKKQGSELVQKTVKYIASGKSLMHKEVCREVERLFDMGKKKRRKR